MGGGWRVPESKLAVQLGLLAVASVPALEVVADERKRGEPKMALVTATPNGADNQLLDTLFATEPVRARVLQLVEEASLSAAISPEDRARLTRELTRVLGISDEARESQS